MSVKMNEDGAVFQLELDASNFQRNTKKARESFSDFASKTVDKMQTVRQQFSNYLVNDLALNAIKGAFESSFEFLSNFASQSQELVKIADAFNAPVEAISELQAIAQATEVDLNDLANAADALELDALNDAAPKLGLNLDELQTKDAAERLAAVLDALKKLPDASERAQLATRLFGESASGLESILNGTTGSTQAFIDKAREAGLIATDASARGAAEFADALTRLKDAATGVGNAFAVALLPAFQEGAELLTEAAKYLQGTSAAADDASFAIDRAAEATKRAREEADALRKQDAEKFRFAEDLAGQGTLVEETFDKAASIIDDLQSRYGDLGFSVDKTTRSITAAVDAQEKFNAAARAQEREQLQKEIAARETKERDLQKRSQEQLNSYSLFSARRVEEYGEQILEERRALFELRKRLESIQESPETPQTESPLGARKPPALAAEGTGEEKGKTTENPETEETILTESANEEKGKTTENPETGEPIQAEGSVEEKGEITESPLGARKPPALAAEGTGEEKGKTTENPETEETILTEGANEEKGEITENLETKESITPRSIATPETKESITPKQTPLDLSIARFEERLRREKLSEDDRRIEDVRKEESDYRSQVETRISEERSKGKSGQDVALIDELQSKIEESTTREAERIELIEKEIFERRKQEAEEAAKKRPEVMPDNILATPLEGQESALNAPNEENELTTIIRKKLEQDEEPTLDDDRFAELLEDADYFDRAYQVAEETAKGTAATFNAFEAVNAANGQNDERALVEAERQTRVLERIERELRNQSATFA